MTKVMVLGLRAFVGAQGGIETHVRDIVSEIVTAHSDEFRVEVIERQPYVIPDRQIPESLAALTLTSIWAPRSQNLETIVHTFLGVVYAGLKRPDILHIHGIGPAVLSPLAKLLGLRVVVTHHGEDFAREKWGWVARSILKLGEWCAARFSDARIVIAPTLDQALLGRHNRVFSYIPNAVPARNKVADTGLVDNLGLEKGKYILHVGRIVPEKRQLDIINAVANIPDQGWKLALVGSSDHNSPYLTSVSEAAARDRRILLTGALSTAQVNELYASALGFILPSAHEGLPIALLEAMSHNLPIVVSNLPSLVELKLPESVYIAVGDVSALQEKISGLLAQRHHPDAVDWSEWLESYTVSSVAERTIGVYRSALGGTH